MRYLARVGLLAGSYFASGTVGQLLAIPPGNVTVVWPSSGIALAAILLGGDRLWPGIWLGAILVNIRTVFDPTLNSSLLASLAMGAAIATGSTAQALAGRRLIDRLAGGRRFLQCARGVILFACAAAIMCLIGSTVGASSLALGGLIPRADYGFTWWTWWLGDTAGVIVVAPLLLAWFQQPRMASTASSRVEAALFLTLLLVVGQLLFGSWLGTEGAGAPTVYLAFPVLMWAAFRFGQRGATMAVLIMTATAICGTARGSGPFRDVAFEQSLWLLQAYGAVLALSTLTLAGLVAERAEMVEGLREYNQRLEQRVAERSAMAEQRAQEARRSEETYREQARTLRSILDKIPEGVIVADSRGRCMLRNPAAEELIGIGLQDINLEEWPSRHGCFLPDRVTPYPPDRQPLARALRGEIVRGDELFMCNPSRQDGIWLSFTAVPLRDVGGKSAGGVIVFRDVSNHKQAEDRLRSVIESVLAGIVMVDEWGRIKLVNRQAEVIFGYTREELCGQPIEILMPEHLSRDHRRYFEGYLQDPRPRPMAASKDIQGLRKDGRSVDLQVALCPIRQDGGLFVLASVRDITEQKRATDLVKSVVEFSPDGIVMVDHDGRIVLVNQETERIFGYAREEILGQSVGVLIPESARDHHHELCVQFVAERRQRLMGAGLDLYARRKDGSEFPVDISLHSYELIGKGCAVACVRDITEHRRAEAQRAELLRRLVSAQEDERQRIARELHDQMGQYLAALGLATKAIQDFLPDEAPCHAHLQQVHQMTCEMGQLVHRLAWELRPSALDDLGLVTVVSQYAAEWAERNGVALHFHTTGLSPPGLSPELETTVYRIVLEALTNIAKHARVEHVGLILEQREDALSVIIEDDGQGFNVEEQMGPGLTGGRLGLLGMRERAALVAGTLTVESAPGEGTTVFLRIPVPIGRKEDANV